MKKLCRKCAPKANPRPLFNFGKYTKTAITYKEFFYKSDILKEDYQKRLTFFFLNRMSSVCHSYVLVCLSYVTRMYLYVIRISLVCTRMSSVCHSYVLVCTPMSSVCHSFVPASHSYVTHMWFYHEQFRIWTNFS